MQNSSICEALFGLMTPIPLLYIRYLTKLLQFYPSINIYESSFIQTELS